MSMMCDVWHVFFLYLRFSHVFNILQSYHYLCPGPAVLFLPLLSPCLNFYQASDHHHVLLTSELPISISFFMFPLLRPLCCG
jgi:hypothetical protein